MLNKLKHTTKLFSLSKWLRNKSCFLFFLLSFSVFGQENLVPNGDFEQYETCPSSSPPYYFVDRATDWFMPNFGDADYFNACSTEFDVSQNTFLYSVPQNYVGYQNALSGNGYAGYYAGMLPNDSGYYEYVSVELTRPLEKDKCYKLTYYLSLADSMFQGGQPQEFVDHSGAYFSQDELSYQDYFRIQFDPQVYSAPGVMLDDSLGWQKIEGILFAEGGEKFLTIGYFFPYDEILFNYCNPNTGAVVAYYFIDDVSLVETELVLPNVLTANNDGVNDVAFLFNLVSLLEVDIVNRWGELVNTVDSKNGWNGDDINGNPIIEGVYFYILKSNGKKLKTGFIQLIR